MLSIELYTFKKLYKKTRFRDIYEDLNGIRYLWKGWSDKNGDFVSLRRLDG